jgi:hypothetical protein
MPSASRIATEAIVVGIAFLCLFGAVHSVDMAYRGEKAMTHIALACHAFLSGVLGHIVFEVTGVNRRYADDYGNV